MATKGKRGPKTAATSPAHIVQVAATANAQILTPLGEGTHVRFYDPLTHESHHVKSRDLGSWIEEVCRLGLKARIRKELESFDKLYPKRGWDDRIKELEEQGIL
jgi:hypothetical protein